MEIIVIDRANISDLDDIFRIEQLSFPAPWTKELLKEELLFPLSLNLVAKHEEKIRGFLLSWLIVPEVHILTVAVEPYYRGRGIGRALMDALFEEAKLNGGNKFTLEVRSSNEIAINFYKKFNFMPKGIRKSYYQDTGEDAIIMWKEYFKD